MSSLFGHFDLLWTAFVFFGTVAFVYSGIIIITSGVSTNHETLVRRAELVMPRTSAAVAETNSATRNLEKRLLRLPGQGFREPEQREIVRRLSGVGIPAAWALTFFAAGRLLTAVLLGLLTMIVLPYVWTASVFIALAAGVCAVAGGWLLPPALIRRSIRRRANAAVAGLPEALDLLVVCVDAGLSLEDGLARVVSELGRSQPELADELALTSADLQILPSRDAALAKMADRVDLPGMRSLVATLTQTLRYGTPLAQSLRVMGAELRNDTLIKLEERANQLPALLTVPLMLFIMPIIFLVIGGPAMLRLVDVFWH